MKTLLAALLLTATAAHAQPSASLAGALPIAPVRTAARLARESAPIPGQLSPASPDPVDAYVAPNCIPSFGTGTTYDVCRLGDTNSRRVVVLLGDSHAWMWIPAFVTAAKRLHFAVVPLAKPGCALWALFVNRIGWPCRTWYRSALRVLKALRPAATVVSFLTTNYTSAQAPLAADTLRRVLRGVPHGIILGDPPSDDWYGDTVPTPSQCLDTPGATLGTCALPETRAMRVTLTHIQTMADKYGYPTIPTIQWFCADDLCPTVVDDTVTSEDGNHITVEYADLLAQRLTGRLRPILSRLRSDAPG